MREINKDTIIKNDKTFDTIKWARSDSENKIGAVSFEELFGDLSNCIFQGNLDLTELNLSSLKGCPQEVEHGYFSISSNSNFKNLDHFPKKLSSGYSLFVDYRSALLLEYVDINIYKNSGLVIYEDSKAIMSDIMSDHNYSNEFHKSIVISLINFREANGDFSKIEWWGDSQLSFSWSYSELEKFYEIYKKVDFNQEKFNRAIELL